jgi:hypothetical protein
LRAVKERIRDLALLKLTCDIGLKIASLKHDSKLISRVASFANLLIVLKLPNNMKWAFFKFAIKKNLKIKNYASVNKIVQFQRKTIDADQTELLEKLNEYEALCK